jgi:hypothetical protein
MLLQFTDGQPFAQGCCGFLYRPATERDTTPRIILTVQISGIETQTALDTGGVYLVCDPEIADLLNLDPSSGVGTDTLGIREWKGSGTLYRLPLMLVSDEGRGLELEVTAFVPSLQPGETWRLPSYMGLSGCLERLRFAVDPATDTFYFGAMEQEEAPL